MTTTELIYAKSPTVIDDGCDHTALIIWRMNANARARTRSSFILPPVPVQVVNPIIKATKPVKKERVGRAKEKSIKTKFSARNLVAVMKGKTLTCQGVLMALDRHYPGHGMSKRALQARIASMLKSPHIDITRHEKPVPEFTLNNVDGRYYINSELSTGAM
ncbi:hypothetical protein [Serratia odorifera]|uniref:hypothetical protein n=1 Tax=Serratia odorifera TaxID=618 RepID=UPI00236246AF|nr:hypothetical protein [Serratia odorifera]